jgi:hypothetical protein
MTTALEVNDPPRGNDESLAESRGKLVWMTALASLFAGVLIYVLPDTRALFPFFKQHPFYALGTRSLGGLLFGIFAPNTVLGYLAQKKFLSTMSTVFQDEQRALKVQIGTRVGEIKEIVDAQYNFARFGLIGIKDNLDMSSLLARTLDGDTLWCLDTYSKSYDSWREALVAALDRGVKVNVLVTDPHGPVAVMRRHEIAVSGNVDEFVPAVEGYKCSLAELQKDHKNLQVLYYDDLPCAPMYLVERQHHFLFGRSSYFLRKPSDFGAHLDWSGASKFGDLMLDYVRHKFELTKKKRDGRGDTPPPPAYAHQAVGYWIYVLKITHPENTEVYGRFYVYDDGSSLHAEGEAFYLNKKPDRLARRGLWRSRSVQILEHYGGMNINYDMVIQTDKAGKAVGKQYIGEMQFKGNPYEGAIRGGFFSRVDRHTAPNPMGSVRAIKLPPSVHVRGSTENYSEYMRKVFEDHLQVDIFAKP